MCYTVIALLLQKQYKGEKTIDERYLEIKFKEFQNERIEKLLNTRVKKYDTAVTIRCKASQKMEFDNKAVKMGITSNELHRYAMQFVIEMDNEHLRGIIGKRI